MTSNNTATSAAGIHDYRAARDRLIGTREDYAAATSGFEWPDLGTRFNWAVDWFDAIARGNSNEALVIVEEDGSSIRRTFDEMATRSDQVAAWLAGLGVARGDGVMLMLGNQVELWESMLAIMKLGAVVLPTTTAVGPDDLNDRVDRGRVKHVIAAGADAPKFDDVPGEYTRIRVGDLPAGSALNSAWIEFDDAFIHEAPPMPHPGTAPDDPLLLYFTSGTTTKPKLVEHTQA